MRFKLHDKYKGMCLLDKNPEGEEGDPDLSDSNLWEDRIITGLVWQRREGWRVETKLRGEPAQQSTLPYPLLNGTIFPLIAASEHNTKTMLSAQNGNDQ